MRKHKRLTLKAQIVRKLAGADLRFVHGGSEPITGPIDVCVPASNGSPTCTGCPSEGCGEGTGWCGPGGTINDSCFGCTLV